MSEAYNANYFILFTFEALKNFSHEKAPPLFSFIPLRNAGAGTNMLGTY